MAVQVDDAGGATPEPAHREARPHTSTPGRHDQRGARRATAGSPGSALKDAEPIDAQVVVFSAGIRPRDALARAAGLDLAERGGVLVDERCRTSDPHVWAIGECAAPGGRMYGLVAPGYAMAEVVVDALLGGPGAFTGADMSTKLKLLGVDVASFGDAHAATAGRARAGLRRRRRRGLQEAGRLRRRPPAARRRPRRRRHGVRRAPADGRQRHRAARQPRGPDPSAAAAGARSRASGCPTRRSSARATTSARPRSSPPPTVAATDAACVTAARRPAAPAAPASRW